MFLHLSSSLQLASPPTSVVRTPASAVSARAVALCCFAGNFICSLRRKREEFSVQLCCQKNSVAVFLPCLRVKFCRAAQVHVLQRQSRQMYARRKWCAVSGCRAKYCIFRRRCMSWPAKRCRCTACAQSLFEHRRCEFDSRHCAANRVRQPCTAARTFAELCTCTPKHTPQVPRRYATLRGRSAE